MRAAIADNLHQIGIVRANVQRAKAALAQRLVVEYRAGDPDVVAAILGARSLDDMLGQVSVQQCAGRQTQRVIRT